MEHLAALKRSLKQWESEFASRHQRKARKEDIEAEPEIQGVYQEYAALKKAQATVQPVVEEPSLKDDVSESDTWGSHLNRKKQIKLPVPHEASLQGSPAQRYGLKLKEKLAPFYKDKYRVSPKQNTSGEKKAGVSGSVAHGGSAVTMDKKGPWASMEEHEEEDDLSGLAFTRVPPSVTRTVRDLAVSSLERRRGCLAGSVPTPTGRSVSTMASRRRDATGEGARDRLQKWSSLDTDWLDRCQRSTGIAESCDLSLPVPPAATLDGLTDVSRDLETATANANCGAHSALNANNALVEITLGETMLETVAPVTNNCNREMVQTSDKVTNRIGNVFDVFEDISIDGGKTDKGFLQSDDALCENEEKSRIESMSRCHVTERRENDTNFSNVQCASSVKSAKEGLQDRAPGSPDGGAIVELAELDSATPSPVRQKRRRAASANKSNSEKTPTKRRRVEAAGRKSEEARADDEGVASNTCRRGEGGVHGTADESSPVGECSGSERSVSVPGKTSGPSYRHQENFVRLNFKAKTFVRRGRGALNGRQLRKQVSKEKWQKKGRDFGGGKGRVREGNACFKCGQMGHWASQCGKGHFAKKPTSPKVEETEETTSEETSPFLTLEEVTRMVNPSAVTRCTSAAAGLVEEAGSSTLNPAGHLPESASDENLLLMNVERPAYEPEVVQLQSIEPLYPPGPNGDPIATPREVFSVLKSLGFSSFRPGQEAIIMRILSGLSSLVVLSTGAGKSLCYQLPALMYARRSACITLVISPLVSLMDDQVSGLPPGLKAACIHSNMTKAQRISVIAKVKEGAVHALLLSPEALVGGRGGAGLTCLPPVHQLPPIAFACIDEAHCLFEWSHNFRPSYLRLCKVLRDQMGIRCMLGLTATATQSTVAQISRHIGITGDGAAVRVVDVPPNLLLTISCDPDRDRALVELLKSPRFENLESIIVYCTRREETARIAALLRTSLQDFSTSLAPAADVESKSRATSGKRKQKASAKVSRWSAESYHAGMTAAERKAVQTRFMRGALRIVVATVAFGMGLDKADVRAIVHYNMPKSFESYVQEIGRAGRDGEPAHCHMFLDSEARDLQELRRHIYANTIDRITVKKLLQKVFPACKCRELHLCRQRLETEEEFGYVRDDEMADIPDPVSDTATAECSHVAEESSEQESVENPCSDDIMSAREAADKPFPQEDGASEKVTDSQRRASPGPQGGTHEDPTLQATGLGDAFATGGGDDSAHLSRPLDYRWNGNDGNREERETWVPRLCKGHERAIPIESNVEALDVIEEGIETLLCYLELHPRRWVECLHPTMATCRIRCYAGPAQLRQIAKSCLPVAVVIARERLKGQSFEGRSELEFDVVELCDSMAWELYAVKRDLLQLQWQKEPRGGAATKSSVLVEFHELAFRFRSPGDLRDEEHDELCTALHGRVLAQERVELHQLRCCFSAFQSLAFEACGHCVDGSGLVERSEQLKRVLKSYFDEHWDLESSTTSGAGAAEEDLIPKSVKEQVSRDIITFLCLHHDRNFSARAIARIFHGIGSPAYPAKVWGRDRRFWRSHLDVDFYFVMEVAKREILRLR
uniref:DNA 3'-5' helicase n=1 Tax=Petromyzon marinus TaxID=7757 RepID=A0AAJ7TL37_PETMA|nr:ATP-dependent DNA helicase Q4 [Petromyzon marinus]XP_032818568.1 ATP-dependent DNA helicase Q4 [Petromyzon marinus]